MIYKTLISTEELATRIDDPNWAIVDCRFALTDTQLGRQRYRTGHIPGAVYAHLDDDLSGPARAGVGGRHPLPDPDKFVETLSNWGIDESVQVVTYDDAGGMVAGRLWWMLRWVGHEAVAVLDGDFRLWQAEKRPVVEGMERRPRRTFVGDVQHNMVVDVQEVMSRLEDADLCLLDARSADRYRGENETLDPQAGHIPGARSAAYSDNLDEAGRFLPPAALRARYEALLGQTSPESAIFYCGSGVSAAHDLLAMAHAGMEMGRLYVGSWSEWSADATRPIATGPEG